MDKVVHQNHRNEQDADLEAVKVQVHLGRLPDAEPVEQDHEREHEERNLQRGADRDADGQVHLVLDGDGDGGGAVSYTHLTLPTKRIV